MKSGTAPNFTYTGTPLIPSSGDAAELPYFSFVEQIRRGAVVVIDRMAVGSDVERWTISIGSGPGRANSKITVEFVGAGEATEPSGITMPAATLEKLLPSASLAPTVNGVNYVSNKNIVSLETSWKNSVRLDGGFFPGSGFQTPGDATSGAIRGRLEFANRQGLLKFVARFENGPTKESVHRHRRPLAYLRREQLAGDHLAEVIVFDGRSRRDGRNRDGRRRMPADVRLVERHRPGVGQVRRRQHRSIGDENGTDNSRI